MTGWLARTNATLRAGASGPNSPAPIALVAICASSVSGTTCNQSTRSRCGCSVAPLRCLIIGLENHHICDLPQYKRVAQRAHGLFPLNLSQLGTATGRAVTRPLKRVRGNDIAPFKNRATSLTGPARDASPVVPSNTVDLPRVALGVCVETGGAVSFVTVAGQTRSLNVADFSILPQPA